MMGMMGWMHLSEAAAGALISTAWEGMLLAAMVGLGLKLAPRTSSGLRFLVWMALFVAVAILPFFSLVSGVAASRGASPMAVADHSKLAAIQLDSRWALGIAALWAILAVARAVGLAKSTLRLGSLRRRSIAIEMTPAVRSLIAGARFRKATLCASLDVDQPCVLGFFAPRILVPGWLLEKATDAELEQIVLHEVSHLRRFDDWTNLFQKLTLTLFPLNPALFWVERRLCAEREGACDERVVRATNAPREYATCLTNLAEERLTRRPIALSLGAWERRSQLAGRVESILRGCASLSPLKARVIAAAMVLATGAGAVKLGAMSQVVGFTPSQAFEPIADGGAATREGLVGGNIHDVVFHPPVPGQMKAESDLVSDYQNEASRPAPARRVAQAAHRHGILLQPALQPASESSPAPRVESVFIVTRWQNSAGQQLTVIDQVFRISALSAAQSSSGWFVVQL